MAKYNFDPDEQEIADILANQRVSLQQAGRSTDLNVSRADLAINNSEDLIKSLGYEMPLCSVSSDTVAEVSIKTRDWKDIVVEARNNQCSPATIEDILTSEDVRAVEARISQLRGDFNQIHKLDALDWGICGAAGVLAALIDIVLVGVPEHEAKGTSQFVKGGSLSNWIRDKISNFQSDSEISKLEKNNWVPFDAANSSRLGVKVEGLNANMHRIMTPGHDPILGFIFGVRDILNGTITVQGKDGLWFVRNVDIKDPAILGMNVFEAIGRVFGHLLSDVSTPAGLPSPLTVLFQGIQKGSFGEDGLPLGQVVRRMYYDGYDFSHFMSMSIPVLLIEVFVRISYMAKRLCEGCSIKDAVPFCLPFSGDKPKLQTMLFTSHAIATAANAGKVYFTGDPLSVNYVQWVSFFRYALPQIKWCISGKESKRQEYTQNKLDESWQSFYDDMVIGFRGLKINPIIL